MAITPPLGLLILDEFTAANGTAISGRSPSPINIPATTYSIVGTATWTIQSNLATKNAGGNNNAASLNAGVADVVITADLTVGNINLRQGLAARITDANNLWVLSWSNANLIEILERNASNNFTRASAALVLTPGSTYQFRLVANGATVTGYVDGVQYVTYGSATFNQAVTVHGLYAAGTALPVWDNLSISRA